MLHLTHGLGISRITAQRGLGDLQEQPGLCLAPQHTSLSALSTWLWPRKPLILWQAQVWYFQLQTNLLGCCLLTPCLLLP